MAGRTGSSSGRAWAALVAALAGVVALPAAIATAELSGRIELLQAAWAIPVAGGLGIAALLLAAGVRERLRRSFGRSGGQGTARAARILGRLAVALALAGTIAVAFYELLVRWSE